MLHHMSFFFIIVQDSVRSTEITKKGQPVNLTITNASLSLMTRASGEEVLVGGKECIELYN